MGCYEAPVKHQTYQSVWVLPDRVTHMEQEDKKRKKTERVQKVISWGFKAPAANCFHCNLINTSRRIDTSSVISNRLFNMPSPRESCVWALKTGRVVVKETT